QAGDSANGLPGITSVSGMWMDYEAWPASVSNLLQLSQTQLNGVMANGRTVYSYYSDPSVPFPGYPNTVHGGYRDIPHLSRARTFLSQSRPILLGPGSLADRQFGPQGIDRSVRQRPLAR